MIVRDFISAEGIAAGLVSAFVPLATIGYLVAQYIADEDHAYTIGYTIAGVIFVYSISSIFMMLAVKKLEKQLSSGNFAPPNRKLKILYGAGLGMMFCLVVIFALLLLSFFSF